MYRAEEEFIDGTFEIPLQQERGQEISIIEAVGAENA